MLYLNFNVNKSVHLYVHTNIPFQQIWFPSSNYVCHRLRKQTFNNRLSHWLIAIYNHKQTVVILQKAFANPNNDYLLAERKTLCIYNAFDHILVRYLNCTTRIVIRGHELWKIDISPSHSRKIRLCSLMSRHRYMYILTRR